MTEPLVSVEMITYNHVFYIAQAIEKVLQQKVDFPIDLVIGEDCSTDGTREIVLQYQKNTRISFD
jgi:glycosyltransferase involved in cell wall biosynthesis